MSPATTSRTRTGIAVSFEPHRAAASSSHRLCASSVLPASGGNWSGCGCRGGRSVTPLPSSVQRRFGRRPVHQSEPDHPATRPLQPAPRPRGGAHPYLVRHPPWRRARCAPRSPGTMSAAANIAVLTRRPLRELTSAPRTPPLVAHAPAALLINGVLPRMANWIGSGIQ